MSQATAAEIRSFLDRLIAESEMLDLLQWLADQPHGWVGKNPVDGGYSCIIKPEDHRNWFSRTFKPLPFIEGQGDNAHDAVWVAWRQMPHSYSKPAEWEEGLYPEADYEEALQLQEATGRAGHPHPIEP